MNVVIVESAAKAKTINKYLGSGYKVIASYGHVRDLPAKDGSVEPDHDFNMHWEVDSKSQKIMREIADAVKNADKLILGEPGGGASDRIERLRSLFENAGIHCEASENVRRAIWYKLWGNATINPMSALTRSTADKLLHDEDLRAFMAEAMDELAAVGAAIGCPISESAEDRMAITARLGAFKSSMLQGVEARRTIELEALLGAPREIAARVGYASQSAFTAALVRQFGTTPRQLRQQARDNSR